MRLGRKLCYFFTILTLLAFPGQSISSMESRGADDAWLDLERPEDCRSARGEFQETWSAWGSWAIYGACGGIGEDCQHD